MFGMQDLGIIDYRTVSDNSW